MVNQVRAPFFVPNPGDATLWTGTPITSAVARLTTTQLKMYGLPGQAPTRIRHFEWDDAAPYQIQPRPKPQALIASSQLVGPEHFIYSLIYDDPSLWQMLPETRNSGPIQLLGIGAKPFNHQWRYDPDNPGVWSGAPTSNELLTPELGIKPIINVVWYLYTDDPSVWAAKPIQSETLVQLGLGKQPGFHQWRYDWDDPALWQSTIGHNSNLSAITANPFLPKAWLWGYDDPIPTSGPAQRVALAPNTFGFNLTWRFNFVDDPSPWLAGPTTSRTIVPNLVTTQFKSHQWLWGLDDPTPAWFVRGPNYNISAVAPSPFIPRQWLWNDEASAFWLGSPASSRVIAQLDFRPFLPPVPAFGDDPGVWTPPTSGKLNLTTVASVPFAPVRWPLAYDDATVLPWVFGRNLGLLAVPFSPRFIPTLDEPPGWSGGIRPVALSISAAAPSPFSPRLFTFASDDPSIWVGQSNNAFFIQAQPLSFVSHMWNLNIPQDTPTAFGSIPGNSIINLFPPPPAVTLIQRTLTGVGL
jgi:hypothetical protein